MTRGNLAQVLKFECDAVWVPERPLSSSDGVMRKRAEELRQILDAFISRTRHSSITLKVQIECQDYFVEGPVRISMPLCDGHV
jgi:hypothetical protein